MNIDYSLIKEKLNNLEIKKIPKTFLQVINKPLDEVVISKYIAYLLDERNTTRRIVKEILTTLQNGETNFIELLESATLENIETEYYINQHNRLDIIIKYDTFWIVIENKVTALESKKNQTSIYEKEIKRINNKNLPIKYIYLKPNYNNSEPSNTNFADFCYGKLTKILKGIEIDELADKESYGFMRDFIKHSEEFLMKNSQIDFDNTLNFYLDNKDKIESLVSNYKTQCSTLVEILKQNIKNEFPEFELYCINGFIQIFKDSWNNSGHNGLHFEVSPNPHFDSLIGKNPVKLTFAIHNEGKTRTMYNIEHRRLVTHEYFFNNNENIKKSINEITKELKKIINKYAHGIDEEIERKKIIKKTN